MSHFGKILFKNGAITKSWTIHSLKSFILHIYIHNYIVSNTKDRKGKSFRDKTLNYLKDIGNSSV